MPPELIANLYRAFSGVSRPAHIDGCPCCVDDKEVRTLLTKELTAITPEEISSYTSSVFLTVGSEADFRYFLPRILEILSSEPGWWPDPEVVGRAIGTFGWEKFNPSQKDALLAYAGSIFTMLLSGRAAPRGADIDSWLCCFSHFLPAWEGFLRQIEQRPPALIALYEWHSSALTRGALANGFWDDSPRKTDFQRWLKRLMDEGRINAAYRL